MIETWVMEWFVKNGNMTREKLEENIDENYLEQGVIDSFGFIALLSECEQKFSISFTKDEFLSDEFLTIRGIIQAIEKKAK